MILMSISYEIGKQEKGIMKTSSTATIYILWVGAKKNNYFCLPFHIIFTFSA